MIAAAGTIGILGLGGAGMASALSASDSGDSLVDRLVAKFHLNKDDVEAVFKEDRDARDAERSAEISTRLQKAVDNGKITAEQKTLIENKLVELKTARETERTALEKWASDNGIDGKYLMGGGPNGDDRLQDAVDSGDLTDAQKKLIEDKRTELKTTMEKQRDELKQWAEDNKIGEEYLMDGGMMRGGGPGRGGMM